MYLRPELIPPMLIQNIGLIGFMIFVLSLIWVIGFAHYKISLRMGFAKPASILMALVGYTGLAPFVWWYLEWPNEKNVSSMVSE